MLGSMHGSGYQVQVLLKSCGSAPGADKQAAQQVSDELHNTNIPDWGAAEKNTEMRSGSDMLTQDSSDSTPTLLTASSLSQGML